MGKIYARAIMRGPYKLSDVPARWYDATVAALKELCGEEMLERFLEREDDE